MQFAKNRICPLCHGEVSTAATWCEHCGRNLPPAQHARSRIRSGTGTYKIISDGSRFRIELRGEARIDGFELENARIMLAVFNSVN